MVMVGSDFIAACIDTVPAGTLQHIIRVESAGKQYAININGKRHAQPEDKEMAIMMAEQALADGYSVDIGLMQINSANFAHVGYNLRQLFEPCNNIKAGAKILRENYYRARMKYSDPHRALAAALSAYNTGTESKGFSNGYVQKFYKVRYVTPDKMDHNIYNADRNVRKMALR